MEVAARHRAARPRQLFEFEVLERLGEGAGSSIYLASDPRTSQLYALKHVIRSDTCYTRALEQLRREHEVCQHLKHPRLRSCYGIREKKSMVWKVLEAVLIMELVDGESMETHPPQDMRQIVDSFTQVATGLAAMHAAGYIHCDLKPNNLLRCADGSIKIIDFGQACPVNTVKERIQGTPDYISPEQVRCKAVNQRTDVYNFGATLYKVLTGRVVPTLFTAGKGANSFVSADMVAAPHEVRHETPPALSALVMECIRTQPATRPAGMNDLLYRLQLVQHTMH